MMCARCLCFPRNREEWDGYWHFRIEARRYKAEKPEATESAWLCPEDWEKLYAMIEDFIWSDGHAMREMQAEDETGGVERVAAAAADGRGAGSSV